MALDLEHFNADPWDLNDIVPNDIEVICFHHFFTISLLFLLFDKIVINILTFILGISFFIKKEKRIQCVIIITRVLSHRAY